MKVIDYKYQGNSPVPGQSREFGVRCGGARPPPGGRHSRVARRGAHARSSSSSRRARWDARRVGARSRSSSRRVKPACESYWELAQSVMKRDPLENDDFNKIFVLVTIQDPF